MNKLIFDQLWGTYVMFKKEFFSTLKSVRMIILMILFTLIVLGTVYGGLTLIDFAESSPDIDLSELMINQGPVFILSMVAGIVSFFGPIIAIALSFDTIVKEKIQNSMSLLICRPVSKRSIATGKFLGIVAALCIPVTIITYLAVLIISAQSGKGIEFGQAGGFIFLTLIFLIIYAAIGQLISSIVKTTTTAILIGIAIWIFLLVIGGVIGYFIPDFSEQISLINPSTPYLISISHALGTLEETSVEVISLGGYYLTFVLWLIVPLFLAIELFNRLEN